MNRERVYTAVALLVAAVFVVGWDVAICPMAGVLGVPCPSCGLTRAAVALLFGDIDRALAMHPLVLPVVVYLLAATLSFRSWRRNAAVVRSVTVAGVVLVGCLILVWGARFFGYLGGPVPVHAWRW